MTRHVWWSLLLVLWLQGLTARAGTRLAVWSVPTRQDAAALLIAELSARAAISGYELLGRDELARVVAEQVQTGAGDEAAVVLRAGRLLGAQGVVWLDEVKFQGRAQIVMRLSAVDSGLVAGWRLDDAAVPDPAGWAARAARQIEEWRQRLGVTRTTARAVSLLNIRRAGATDGGAVGEQVLTFLLGQALANRPHLRVLERWRLDDLALEGVLGGEAGDAFWQGAVLVDGSFTESDGEIALNLRTRPALGDEARWTTTGRDVGKLIADAAEEVARRVSGEPSPAAWDRPAEAREFLDEARWAARWNLHAKVVEAAEAAIVLGGTSPELRRLRYLAQGRLLWGGHQLTLSPGGGAPQFAPPGTRTVAPAPERIAAAKQVLDLFADHRARPEGRAQDERSAGPPRMGPPGIARHTTRAEMDAVELLGGAARVLRDAYRASILDSATSDAAAALRRTARETFERERRALGLRSRPRAPGAVLPEPSRGGPFNDPGDTLLLVGYAQGALWAERLAEHQELATALLAEDVDGEPELLDHLLRLTTSACSDAWEVDWATRDYAAARARWSAKAREWMQSTESGLALAGALQLLALNFPFELPPPGSEAGYPPEWEYCGTREEQESRVAEALRFFAAAREGGRRIPEAYLDGVRAVMNGRAPAGTAGGWARLRSPVAGEGKARAKPVTPASVTPQVRQAKIPMVLHWLTPEARVPATGLDDYNRRRGIRWAERVAGRVRVITEERAEGGGGAQRFTLSEIELTGFRERRLGRWSLEGPRDSNDHMGFPAFAVIGERVFCWEGGELWRRDLNGNTAKRLDLPVTGQARLWALGERLYVASNEGGVLRVHPETGAWEMLADSRRRPAEGPLDDRRRYEVQRMWLGADGAARACVTTRGEQIFRRDEAARTWVLEASEPHGNLPGYRYQRAECVAWLEDIGLAVSGHGRRELERLLRDVARAGDWRVPEGFDPGGYFAGQSRISVLGGMTRRGDVWALYHFWHEPRRSPRLVWMPAPESGKEIVCAELAVPEALLRHLSVNPSDHLYGGIGGEYARFLSGPEGLVIYATGSPVLWFMSKERFDTAGLAWAE